MKRFLLFLWLIFCPLPATAAELTPEMVSLFQTRCGQVQVPPALALAIAKQESSFHPWAVNVAGKTYMPATRKEALQIIHRARARGLSHDIGMMQVNSWWLRRLNLAPEQVIDPVNNILVGSLILRGEIDKYGLTWRAVAAYHTPLEKHPQRARQYAVSVIRHMRKLLER